MTRQQIVNEYKKVNSNIVQVQDTLESLAKVTDSPALRKVERMLRMEEEYLYGRLAYLKNKSAVDQ